MILKCTCQHEGQDKLHGKGMRVHNTATKIKGASNPSWRCTVCGNEKPRGAK